MIDRRQAIRLGLVGLPAALLFRSSTARAEQAFTRFIPFLVELDGWQGKKPNGMSMEIPGNSMITATREYRRDAARLAASIVVGAAAQGALAAAKSGMNIETSDGRMSTSTIDGLPVTRTFNFKDKSGTILVALSTNAMFNLSNKGIADDEALALAKKFNWKAIQAALPK